MAITGVANDSSASINRKRKAQNIKMQNITKSAFKMADTNFIYENYIPLTVASQGDCEFF